MLLEVLSLLVLDTFFGPLLLRPRPPKVGLVRLAARTLLLY